VTLRDSRGARVDPLRYGKVTAETGKGNELAFLRLRYKRAEGGPSTLIERPLSATVAPQASERLRFAAAVAAFADALRGGKYLDGYDYAKVATLANGARGRDEAGYRAAFVQLVRSAGALGNAQASTDIIVR
jgi:Ca-activated chloride channel homolog